MRALRVGTRTERPPVVPPGGLALCSDDLQGVSLAETLLGRTFLVACAQGMRAQG